jgi:prepilin-type N-terminal cleavage/methylation domain-containing protein
MTACSCGALAPLATLKGRDYVKDYKVQIMKLKTTEKGFTLIELLVGIAIAVFVVGAASMTVITMMRLSPQSNNWAIALRQVQNTGYWISRDVQMSDTVTPGTGDTFLTLRVPYESEGEILPKEIDYLFGDISGERWLIRTDSTGGQTAIAQYISEPIQYEYDPDTRTLTFTITATSGNVPPVTRKYEAVQRVPAP